MMQQEAVFSEKAIEIHCRLPAQHQNVNIVEHLVAKEPELKKYKTKCSYLTTS